MCTKIQYIHSNRQYNNITVNKPLKRLKKMCLFMVMFINLKLGRASYAITNEICNESFLALENLVTQPPQPTPSSPNFRSFSADLCALICFDWNFFKHFAKIHDENCHLEDKSFLLK